MPNTPGKVYNYLVISPFGRYNSRHTYRRGHPWSTWTNRGRSYPPCAPLREHVKVPDFNRFEKCFFLLNYHLTMNKSIDVCIISFDDEQVYRRLYHIIWRWKSTFVSYHWTMNKYMDVCIISFDDEQGRLYRLYHIIWRWTSHLTMNKSIDVCIISFDDEQVYGRLYHIIWRWTSLWTFVSYHLDDEQVYGRLYHIIWRWTSL